MRGDMRRAFILIPILMLTAGNYGQTPTPCNLTVQTSPAIRGIRLGMAAEELRKLLAPLGQVKIDREVIIANSPGQYDFASFDLNGNELDATRFDGVAYISISLYKNLVVSFTVSYIGPPTGPRWRRIDEWIAKLSEAYHLPEAAQWEGDSNQRTLKCNGLVVRASAGGISLEKPGYQSEIDARKEAVEEKKRREFKP